MARNGRVVIRPDSGCPVKIMTGDLDSTNEFARKGVIECLYDTFGGTVTEKGYKLLDSHIGAIYGDSITRERATAISELLKQKGFASVNAVYGIGSYTYQYNTRDTFGYAMKSTLVVIDGKEVQIFKDPVTDNGTKKSAKGGVRVVNKDGILTYEDCLSLAETEVNTLLVDTFENGKLLVDEKFSDIRARVLGSI
jgi:nicotinamide phosphoribosyltransferase